MVLSMPESGSCFPIPSPSQVSGMGIFHVFSHAHVRKYIPAPQAMFYIEGSRYICEKITATFHESTGKSQLLRGVFYRII